MAGTTQEVIQDLLREANHQLQLTLSSQDAQAATKRLGTAQKLTARLERMVLSNPMGTEAELETIVFFTRGQLWSEARAHLAQLNR